MTPYDWKKKAILLWIGCLLVTGIGTIVENQCTKIIAAFILIIGFILLILGSLKYWRCPVCGGLLQLNLFFIISECPHCGHKL